jgi:hypothetical protein
MTTSTYDLMFKINDMVCRHIDENMKETNAAELGLDPRAGYRLFVDDSVIAVEKDRDGALQYYGGFEYIDKSLRSEMGDYVFYLRDESSIDYDEDTGEEFYDCRVGICLQRYNDKKEKVS